MFDFAPPNSATEVVTTFQAAADNANYYKGAYYKRAANVANGFQFFEVPIIGSAVTAVTAAAFKASNNVPLGAGIAGGTFAILEGFYDPRDRTVIYIAGHDAMSCIQRLAAQGHLAYENLPLSAAALDSIRADLAGADNSTSAGLQKALDVNTQGPSELDDATMSINANITKQAISKASRPDTQQIAANLRQASNQAQQNKSNIAGVSPPATRNALAMASPSVAERLANRGTFGADAVRAITEAQIKLQSQQILDYSANFDAQLTTCKSFAG